MVLLLLVDTKFKHHLTDLHLPKVSIRRLSIRKTSSNFLVQIQLFFGNFLLVLGTGKALI